MAGKPIDIPISITADDTSGVDKIADSFNDVEDSLKDVENAGEKAGDGLSDSFEKVEDDLKGISKASDKAADDLKSDMSDAARKIDRDLTEALKEVEKQAKDTGKTVGREVKDGTNKASEGFSELKDESASTAKEAAASFGSIEDAADALQEVAANAFVGFGPAGMAAGLVAAAGIGLAISALQENADKINENKERISGLAQAMKENGGALTMGDYIQSMEDYGYAIQDTKEFWEIFQEDAVTGFEEMSQLSKDAGIDLKTAFDGAFGSLEDAEKGLGLVNDKLTDLEEKKKAVYEVTGQIIDPVDAETLGSLTRLKEKFEENKKAQQDAVEMEKIRRAGIEGTVEATLEDIAALERKNSLLQDGVTSELDYLDAVAQTTATLAENGATLDINSQAGRDNQRALMDLSDSALNMADSQLQAGVSADTVAASLANQRESLLVTLDAMTGNRAASEELAAALGLIPTEVITEVQTNGAVESKASIDTIPAEKQTDVTVDDGGSAAQTQARVNSVEGKDIKIDVQDFNTVSQTQGRIDGIKGKDVKIDVQDFNTVSQTQTRINDLQGKDVRVNVYVGNEAEFNGVIARMTAAASKTITVREVKDPMTP